MNMALFMVIEGRTRVLLADLLMGQCVMKNYLLPVIFHRRLVIQAKSIALHTYCSHTWYINITPCRADLEVAKHVNGLEFPVCLYRYCFMLCPSVLSHLLVHQVPKTRFVLKFCEVMILLNIPQSRKALQAWSGMHPSTSNKKAFTCIFHCIWKYMSIFWVYFGAGRICYAVQKLQKDGMNNVFRQIATGNKYQNYQNISKLPRWNGLFVLLHFIEKCRIKNGSPRYLEIFLFINVISKCSNWNEQFIGKQQLNFEKSD